jgi:hypothetical protein
MKKFIIIVAKHGRPSTKELFKKIAHTNAEHVIKSAVFEGFVKRTNPLDLTKRTKLRTSSPYDCTNAVVIRWGWYGNIDTDSKSIVYNKAEAIKLANDKGVCRKFLASKNIDVPKTYLLDEISELLANDGLQYPIIARPSHHGRGKNLWICENIAEIREAIRKGATYFSEIYPKTEEYRVHCALGKVIEVMQKPAPEDTTQVAWNRAQNDAPFTRVPWDNWKNYICKLALRATKELGLDIAGVDIMVQKTDRNLPKAVVCEVNTAPTLNSSPHVLERYSLLFNKLANSDTRVEHWDFEQFTTPSSLAWKTPQF